MLAITIRQPWAWAIMHAGKSIENRSWLTSHRGPLLIHAGKTDDPAGYVWLAERGIDVPQDLQRGGIIGRVELVACVRDSDSEWARPGQYHWLLAAPTALPFRPARGQQGLFHVGGRPQQTFSF